MSVNNIMIQDKSYLSKGPPVFLNGKMIYFPGKAAMKLFFIALFILNTSQSGFQEFVPERGVAPIIKKSPKPSSLEKNLQRLIEQDKKIEQLLSSRRRGVLIKKKSEKVMALARFKGIVLNSIIAMNVRPSKFITQIKDGKLAWIRVEMHGL